MKMSLLPSCFSRQDASNHMSNDLKGQDQYLTSGQGHVLTQRGHVAYQSMSLDETNTMTPFPPLYLFPNESYWQKKMLVTSVRSRGHAVYQSIRLDKTKRSVPF